MADAGTIISNAISFYDGVDPDDADNALRRVRLLNFLQHIYDYVWNYRTWQWTYAETTITVGAGDDFVTLPDDYAEMSPSGRLTLQRTSYHEISPLKMHRLRKEGPGSLLNVFSIYGGNINIPSAVSGSTIFDIFYRVRPEALTDDSTALVIPDRYANLVLLPGLIFRTQEGKNDARSTWKEQFQAGLSQMASLENPLKTAANRWPMSYPGAW